MIVTHPTLDAFPLLDDWLVLALAWCDVLPVFSAWWIVDAWLHVLCARNRKAWRESTAWWWLNQKIVFFFFLILSFCQFFFPIFVAHDFLDPPTWLSGFFRRLKVLQSDWSVGLTNPSLPHLLAARYVREVSNILRRAVKGQHRSSPWVKLILSHCWALPGVDSATETGKKSRFFPNSVHQWVARSIQTATVGIVSFEHWWYDS